MSQDDRGSEIASKELRTLREGVFMQENDWRGA
jgi:hypothetical protein